MTTSISPLNQALIEKTKQNNGQNVQKQAPIQTPVPKTGQDTFELSTKSTKAEKAGIIDKIKANKKSILIAAIGLCAAIGGVAICAKKGILPTNISAKADKVTKRGNEILEQGEKIAVQGSEIVEESKRQLDEVLKLIKRGKENNFQDVTDDSGKVIRIRRFVDLDGTKKAMEELEGDKVVRRTEFNPDYCELAGVNSIIKDYTELADGSKKYAEKFVFGSDELAKYIKDGEELADGSKKYAEEFDLFSNKIYSYKKNYKKSAGKSMEFAEGFMFDGNNKVTLYNKGHKGTKESEICAESFEFKDGKACSYQRGYEASKDGDVKIAKEFELKDDKWKKIDKSVNNNESPSDKK